MRIIQLETAVGAAMKNFEGAHGRIKIRILPTGFHIFLLVSVVKIY